MFIIISIILGIVLGIIYNKSVIKSYPEEDKKMYFAVTIIIFLLFSLSISVVISLRSYTNNLINDYSVIVEGYIYENYANEDFVKNGYDLQEITNSSLKLDSVITGILPTSKDLGVSKIAYEYIANKLTKHLQTINSFGDKDNRLTVSSIIHSLKKSFTDRINKVSFIIITIVSIIFIAYIICTLIVAKKEENKKKQTIRLQ